MEFIASKSIIEGEKILALFKKGDDWVIISEKDNHKDTEIDENNFFLVEEEFLIDKIPKLKGNLDQPDQTIINVDYNTGEINFNKKHFHFGIPTHEARASRQANTEFSYLRWLSFNKRKYFKSAFWLLVLVVLGYIWGWLFYILAIVPIVLRYLIDSKNRDMYYSGALVPAMVLNADKGLIAVLTDLSLGHGSYPLIKIEKRSLPKSHNIVGKKIAVAGGYQQTEDYPHWNFFEPSILLTGMKFPEKHEEKVQEIPNTEWIKLYSEIAKLDENIKPGYYPIDIEKSDWKDVDIEKIEWVPTW